jgi:hypothetical protein
VAGLSVWKSGQDSSPLAWFQGFNLEASGSKHQFWTEAEGLRHNRELLTFSDLVSSNSTDMAASEVIFSASYCGL